jgi:hypothetical protein
MAAGASLLVLLSSCDPPKIVVNPAYKGDNITAGSLSVVLCTKPDISYDGDIEPEFGKGKPEDLILGFFKKQLLEEIQGVSSLSPVIFDSLASEPFYETMRAGPSELGDDAVPVPIPGSDIQPRRTKPDFILLLNNLSIGTESVELNHAMGGLPGMVMVTGSDASKQLAYHTGFVLWDLKEKRYVAYGRVDESSSNGIVAMIAMSNWNEVGREFVESLFKNLPFARHEYCPSKN